MSDPMKQAWNDVADGFSELGRLMKDRYDSAREQNLAGETDADGDADADADGERGAALRDALDRFLAAGREFGDRAADVARDDDIKEQARRAAARLNDALAATVDTIGDQVGGLFKRSSGDRPADAPDTAPPSDDVRQ